MTSPWGEEHALDLRVRCHGDERYIELYSWRTRILSVVQKGDGFGLRVDATYGAADSRLFAHTWSVEDLTERRDRLLGHLEQAVRRIPQAFRTGEAVL